MTRLFVFASQPARQPLTPLREALGDRCLLLPPPRFVPPEDPQVAKPGKLFSLDVSSIGKSHLISSGYTRLASKSQRVARSHDLKLVALCDQTGYMWCRQMRPNFCPPPDSYPLRTPKWQNRENCFHRVCHRSENHIRFPVDTLV